MLVHNCYSDLLSSSTYFLNNFILSDHHIKIKHFQYNIGNSSFQLDHGTQHELPAAIVTLQSINPFINHPHTFHRAIGNNMNKIPVLYDRTKNIELFLQEEMYTIAVTININCDSQLQALEVQHRMMNYIPLNKYLQAYRYTSFFELDPNLLSKYLIDVRKDKIENLFYKQNKYTDTFDYCFAVEYEPLMRLNGCDIGIESSVNSSFQVACSFEFLTHVPVYMVTPKVNWDSLVSSNYLQYNKIPVPVRSDIDNILIELNNPSTNIPHKEIWQMNNGQITGEFKYINKTFDVTTLYNKMKLDGILHIQETINGEIVHSKCFIEGDRINGTLRQVQFIEPTVATVYFEGVLNGKHISDFLNFEVIESNSIKVMDMVIINSNPPFEVTHYKILPKKINVLNSIKNINKSAVKINPSKTYITSYVDIYNNEIILPSPIYINEYTNEFNLPNGVTGYLDLDTFDLYLYSDIHPISYLYFNLSFDYVKGIPSTIERINYNFNIVDQIIVNQSPYSTLTDFSEMNVAIISKVELDEANNQIYFNMGVSTVDLSNIEFKFITLNKTILDYNHLKLDLPSSINNKLVFQLANISIYWRYFSKVNTLEPIYFCYNFNQQL